MGLEMYQYRRRRMLRWMMPTMDLCLPSLFSSILVCPRFAPSNRLLNSTPRPFIAAEGSRNSIPLSSNFGDDDDACVRAGQRPPPDTDGHRSPLGGCVPLAHANAVPIGCRPAERRSIARCGEEARDRASGGDASGKQSRCIHLCTYLFSSYAHLALPAQVHLKLYSGISCNKFNSTSEWLF